MSSRSLFTVAFQFFLGLPLFFFPCGFHWSTCFGILFCCIRCTCPNHCNRFLLMMSSSLSIPVLLLTSSFVILSFQMMPRIFLCHLWCAASRRFILATVIGHVSAPYNKIDMTNASYSRIFILKFSLLFLQMLFSLLNAICLARSYFDVSVAATVFSDDTPKVAKLAHFLHRFPSRLHCLCRSTVACYPRHHSFNLFTASSLSLEWHVYQPIVCLWVYNICIYNNVCLYISKLKNCF